MAAQCAVIDSSAGGASDKAAQYCSLFDELSSAHLSGASSDSLSAIGEVTKHVVDASFQVSRPVLEHVSSWVKTSMEKASSEGQGDRVEALIKLAEVVVRELGSRQSSFLAADYSLREALYAGYVHVDSSVQAASTLAGMDIEAVATAVSMADTTKALVYVRIAQNYLRAGDDYHADEFIRKANNAGVMECGDPMVEVQFQVCMGFVQDARRNYAQAAVWFHRVSTVQHEGVDASELETLLQQATVSAVLSPPGPSRTRILDVVMRDARTASLPTASMVAKMHKGHFITAADISSFSELLKSEPAKLAPDADGLNDVQKAARLHNLAAVARVYRNISFESLGRLLGVSAEDAEDLAARMIMEDRLAGTIDQESGTLEFAKSADPLHTWDARLTAATGHLSSVSERIASKHPSLAEEAVHRAASTDPTLE